MTAPGLSPGPYAIVAFAHSTVAGTFNLSAQARVTVAGSLPLMALDVPAPGSTIGPAFHVGGWAIDRAASSGTGVDTIHVWAFPNPGSGQAPIFLGVAAYGGSRPDVGGIFGSQFTNSGFNLEWLRTEPRLVSDRRVRSQCGYRNLQSFPGCAGHRSLTSRMGSSIGDGILDRALAA